MALTYTLDSPPAEYVGANRVVRGTITFDSDYVGSGGEAVTIADLGLSRLIDIQCDGDDGYVVRWNRSTSAPKLIAYWVDTSTDGAPLVEATAATNLSAVISRFVATGK